MNELEERIETGSGNAPQGSETAEQPAGPKPKAGKKPLAQSKKRVVKRKARPARAGGVSPLKRRAIRRHLTRGKTESETVDEVGETLETVKREARLFWEEMSTELLANPTTSRVQAVMRALNVYAGSQEAISALAKDKTAKPADRVKYMELALDANKEIMRYQSMERPAEVTKDAGRNEERATREQLDTAIALLDEHIGRLKREDAGGGESKAEAAQ